MYSDDDFRWGSLTINISESYNGVLKKARGLPVTAMVCMTLKALVDDFIERNALGDALIAKEKPWPVCVEKKFNEYWTRAQAHTEMVNYTTTSPVFEILTFARNGKGGNFHRIFVDSKNYSCGKWKKFHMPCSHTTKLCGVGGIEPKQFVCKYYSTNYYKKTCSDAAFTSVGAQTYWPPASFSLIANTEYFRTTGQHEKRRRKNEVDIAPAGMSRKCSTCKHTGHTKARCPSRNPL